MNEQRHFFRFLRFGLVGGTAFLIDVGMLHLFLQFQLFGPFVGRAISYSLSAIAAWFLHRSFTFSGAIRSDPAAQLLRFLVLNGLGGLLNYAVYALLVLYGGAPWSHFPEMAAIVGSGVAMVVNYFTAALLVFRVREGEETCV